MPPHDFLATGCWFQRSLQGLTTRRIDRVGADICIGVTALSTQGLE
jgi:hypothetical protein